jgi:hypothetical protein
MDVPVDPHYKQARAAAKAARVDALKTQTSTKVVVPELVSTELAARCTALLVQTSQLALTTIPTDRPNTLTLLPRAPETHVLCLLVEPTATSTKLAK